MSIGGRANGARPLFLSKQACESRQGGSFLMPLVGSHRSIAGGYYKAVEEARRLGLDCVQIFTKNNNQWRAAPLTDDAAARFKESLTRCAITHPIAHNSYLINLAATNDELWEKSIASMILELERAARLGIPYVVAHPGSHGG